MAKSDANWDEELAARMIEIAGKSTDEEVHPFQFGMSWERGGNRLTISEEAAQAFLDAVSDTSSLVSQRFSETLVREKLIAALFAARDVSNARCVELIKRFRIDYENWFVEQTVYLPMGGLDLAIERLTLGGVTFTRVNEDVLKPLSVSPDEHIRGRIAGRICAVHRVVAEPTRAGEIAKDRTRKAADLLMYANVSANPFHPQGEAIVAIEGERPADIDFSLIVSKSSNVHTLEARPKSWNVRVSWGTAREMQSAGVGELSHLLLVSPDKLTEIEQKVLTAIHWLGYSMLQRDAGGAFTSLFIALEALIPKGLDAGKDQRRIALGVARMLGQDKGGRVYRRMQRLYSHRTDVTHEGRVDKTESDAQELRWYVARVVQVLVANLSTIRSSLELETILAAERTDADYIRPYSVNTLSPVVGTGPWIRDRRVALALSQSELAQRVDQWTEEHHIQHWEASVLMPDLSKLIRLAEALEVDALDVDFFYTERLIRVAGRLFHIQARETDGGWKAKVIGWQTPPPDTYSGLTETVLIDEDRSWPNTWEASGNGPKRALDDLESEIEKRLLSTS